MPNDKILVLAKLAEDLGRELQTSRLEEVAAELGVKIDSIEEPDAEVLDRLSDVFELLKRRAQLRSASLEARRRRSRTKE